MDKSEEYCKMCNCSEIQDLRGGFSSGEIGEVWVKNGKAWTYRGRQYVGGLWLPRQGQLIEMLKDLAWEMACNGKDYGARVTVRAGQIENNCYGPSSEQVLLELVMLTLHNKKWTGEVWEK